MDNTAILDVLIVYSSTVALSASVPNGLSRHPFALGSAEEGYNKSYAYFLRECQKAGLRAGFAASSDVIGAGTTKSYWMTKSSNWVKVPSSAQSNQIFDKLSSPLVDRANERSLLFSNTEIRPFNDFETLTVLSDKFQTFQKFSHATVPTVTLSSRKATDIKNALAELEAIRQLPQHRSSFSNEIIVKDRYGAGGTDVYKLEVPSVAKIQTILRKHPEVTFVLQPFLLFDSGYSYNGEIVPTDIRLIFQNGQLLQSYLRMAQAGDFRCNAHQGGEVVYIEQSELPLAVVESARRILQMLATPKALVSLDFAISNSGTVYLVEGNCGPGLCWDEDMKSDEKMAKQLIRSIVKELAERTKNSPSSTESL